MSQPLLQVFVFRSGSYVGSEIFTEPEIVIGSGDGVDLYIEEAAANHAILNRNDGQATLLDLGSPLGTKVNRAAIQHCYVTPRDEIQIAGYTLKLKFVQAARTAPAAAPPTSAPPSARPREAQPSKAEPLGSIEDLISNELGTDATPLSPDVIASEDIARTPDLGGESEFGSLDDALNSAFVSREEDAIPIAPSQSSSAFDEPAPADFEPETRAMVPEAPPQAPETNFPRFDAPEVPLSPSPQSVVAEAAEPDQQLVAALNATQPPLPDPFENLAPADDEVLDEDELEAEKEPDFSLVEKLVQEGNVREGKQALELLCHRDDTLRAATMITKKGDKIVLGRRRQNQVIPDGGHRGLPLARVLDVGKAEIRVPASAEGFILQHGMRVPLDQLKTPERAVNKKANAYRIPLAAGAQMHLDLGETTYFLRFVDPPPVKQEPFRFVVEKMIQYSVGGAVGLHLVAFLIIGLMSSGEKFSELASEQWAEPEQEEIRDVEIEPEPEPEPVVEETPEPEPEPEPPPPEPKRKPRRQRKPEPKAKTPPGPPKGAPAKEVKKAGVLGAMGKLNLAAPGKKAMVQAVSNVDAVKTPGGSNYRVGALVGKTPSSKLSVGGGGGGKLLTRGSASLLKGGSGLAKIGQKGGSVRGKVARASSRRLQSQGSIDRNAVLKVINSHISEVQYCYEKNLLKDPSLKGKVSVEWTIGGSGSVTRVRQKTSTLRSPQVSSCILQAIKRWRFPKPTGGNVTISFPFVFSQSQF